MLQQQLTEEVLELRSRLVMAQQEAHKRAADSQDASQQLQVGHAAHDADPHATVSTACVLVFATCVMCACQHLDAGIAQQAVILSTDAVGGTGSGWHRVSRSLAPSLQCQLPSRRLGLRATCLITPGTSTDPTWPPTCRWP